MRKTFVLSNGGLFHFGKPPAQKKYLNKPAGDCGIAKVLQHTPKGTRCKTVKPTALIVA